MGLIKSFWRLIQKLQSFVGTLLFLIVLLIFSAIILSNFMTDSEEGVSTAKNSALVLDFKGLIVEQEAFSSDPYEQLFAGDIGGNTRLRDIERAIDLAAEDVNIKMLVLDFSQFAGAYPSKLHYIGRKIEKFKNSGKKVVTYGSLYSQSAYLLASFADEIYMHPQGAVLIYGYGGFHNYFLGFLNKIKAEVQLFRVGKYKSAMEPFIRNDMSDEAREANLELYNSFWDSYLADISEQRGIDEAVLRAGIDNADELLKELKGDLGQLALQNSLVDGLKTRAEWVSYMQNEVGKGRGKQEINQINLKAYLASKFDRSQLERGNNIVAIIYANGTIMDGVMPQGTVGGDTLSRQLREARLDDRVKAVVLRVESPGGSAFAAELIRQEVLLLKAAGKPVIASFGGVAASGGYWISANADEIWASPTTITGSIGIFGAIPNIEGTLAEIGITTDGIGTTPLVSAGINKPLPEKLKNIIQTNIENGYDRFLSLVAEGRHMSVEQVNEIAQGRVWTGAKALEIGLVDHLGNLDHAIKSAVSRADLKDYNVVYWEDELPIEVQIMSRLFDSESKLADFVAYKQKRPEQILMNKITEKLSPFSKMNDPQHAYVLCVECMKGINSQY